MAETITIDSVIDFIGGNGSYQKKLLLYIFLIHGITTVYGASLPLILDTSSCDCETGKCDDDNMASDLEMYCEDEIYGVYVMSMYFAGYLFGAGLAGMLAN
jgi:hypothetical protein